MAFSLQDLRSKILTSIRGHRLGFDKDDFLVGVKGTRVPVTNGTSDTTATALLNHGFQTVVSTTNDTWTLTDPVPGMATRIAVGSSSTGLHSVVPAAATIISSNGSAGSSIILSGPGAYIELTGVTTAQWIVSAIRGTTTGNCYAAVSS